MSKLPTLELLPHAMISPHSPWCFGLRDTLALSNFWGLAEVKEINTVPTLKSQVSTHSNKAFFAIINNNLIMIDVWEYDAPSLLWMYGEGKDFPVKLILAIQAKQGVDYSQLPGVTRKVPVRPWTMFHTDQISWFEELPERRRLVESSFKMFTTGFSGRAWRNRTPWIAELKKHSWAVCSPWPTRATPDTTNEYVARTASWKTCLGLRGKSSRNFEAKNRREPECMGLGIPLVLNYMPYYPDPMIPGQHFIYLEKPEDIATLPDKTKDLSSMISEARVYWEKNFSLRGVCESFFRVCRQEDLC